ncbi:MAG: von Willebrand factor type A domain-containing protein [Pseudorhodobacter sp.]|nr:von Willebrand factor type A domain-containing protein [Pseudorhodobacter sp.]
MTDDLGALRAALHAIPAANVEARADAIALAMKNFDAQQKSRQGSAGAMRLTQDRHPSAGFLRGAYNMLKSLTSRPILAATTSVVALSVGLVIVLPMLQTTPPPTAVVQPEVVSTTPATSEVLPAPSVTGEPVTGDKSSDDGGNQDHDITLLATPELEAQVLDQPGIGAAAGVENPSYPPSPAPIGKRVARAGRTLLAEGLPPEGMADLGRPAPENSENFANAAPNPLRITADEPVSTFSIDVDTASYAVVRSSLMNGALPDAQAVRIEEMVNYFPYTYPAPALGEAPFRSTVTVMSTPWNSGTRLVHIALQGRLPAVAERPALNLVFLIDTSGSMDEPNKLPLLKQSFKLLLAQLRPEDEVAIVAYAGSAGEVLAPTKAADRDAILAALDRLEAGGATAGAEGLALAYQVARRMGGAGEVSRVLLATDGDFNVGIDDPEGLTHYIARQRDSGVYLSVLGFGRGNLDDATMQALAQNGNGQAAYIDTMNEARKVLVDQLSGALFPIAEDVKIQVEWNPALVAEYRLIGYETRALRREDFNNDRIDAGEIGAGHTVTAIYEVTAPGSAALRNDPLRYGTAQPTGEAGELGFLRLRYKAPGEDNSALIESPILPDNGTATDDVRFAAAIAGFGQLLTGASYLGEWGWDQAIALALEARGDDPFGYRIEAVNLMRMAQSLAGK